MDMKIDFTARDTAQTIQGWPIHVDGVEEIAQSILLRLSVPRGSFRLDPTLGSRLYALPRGSASQLETFARQAVEEAVAEMPGVLLTGVSCRYDADTDQGWVDCGFSWKGQEIETTVGF